MRNCTFAPLSRSRYRCNQTGKVLKKRQLQKYRARALPKPPPPRIVASQELAAMQAVQPTYIKGDEEVFFCPHCDAENDYIVTGRCRCVGCKRELLLRLDSRKVA